MLTNVCYLVALQTRYHLDYTFIMTITVNSPFTGRPVKIREKDVGRAVTDEDGGIFYVFPKKDGRGYYGAPTRAGGERDEERAARNEARAMGSKHKGVQRGQVQITKSRGSHGMKKLFLFLFLLIVAILAWAVIFGPLKEVARDLVGGEAVIEDTLP